MADIMKNIYQEFLNGFADFGNYFSMVSEDSIFANFTTTNLTDLFLTKKMIETTNANRYEDLLNNKVDYPYLQLAPYITVDEILKIITSGLTWSNILGSVNFTIPINQFI